MYNSIKGCVNVACNFSSSSDNTTVVFVVFFFTKLNYLIDTLNVLTGDVVTCFSKVIYNKKKNQKLEIT